MLLLTLWAGLGTVQAQTVRPVPEKALVMPGETIQIAIDLGDEQNTVANLMGLGFAMTFDAAGLTVVSAAPGGLLATDLLSETSLLEFEDALTSASGRAPYSVTRPAPNSGVSGFGTVALIEATIPANAPAGLYTLALEDILALDPDGNAITIPAASGSFSVGAQSSTGVDAGDPDPIVISNLDIEVDFSSLSSGATLEVQKFDGTLPVDLPDGVDATNATIWEVNLTGEAPNFVADLCFTPNPFPANPEKVFIIKRANRNDTWRVIATALRPNATSPVQICAIGVRSFSQFGIVSLSASAGLPVVDLSERTIAFGNQRIETTSGDQTITLTNTGDADLTFTRIALDENTDDAFLLPVGEVDGTPVVVAPAASHTVTIQFAPPQTEAYTATLSIESDAVNGNEFLSLSGTGVVPVLEVDNGNLDFGDQRVGVTSTAIERVIENTGSDILTITDISLLDNADGAFSLTGGVDPGGSPLTLGLGETTTISIQYTPADTEDHQATLQILSDGGEEDVTVRGTGIAPLLAVGDTEVPFGEQRVDVPSDALEVRIDNDGSDVLLITDISLQDDTDNVFVLTGGTESGTISVGAGEQHTVSIQYTPTDRADHTASLQIQSDGGSDVLPVSGKGIAPVLSTHRTDLPFAPRRVGSTSDSTLTITNTGDAPLLISRVELLNNTTNAFEIISGDIGAGDNARTVDSDDTYEVVVRFTPPASGDHTAQLRIESDSHEGGEALLDLSGQGSIPVLALDNTVLTFPSIPVTEQTELVVTVSNTGEAVLEVSDLELRDVAGKRGAEAYAIIAGDAPFVVFPAGSREVTIRFAPETGGTHDAELAILSDADPGEHIVTLTGVGLTAAVGLSTDPLDFGLTAIDEVINEQSLTLTNTGEANLEILDMRLEGADADFFAFVSGDEDGILAPTETRIIVLAFDPDREGAHTASLLIESNAPPDGTTTVALTGTGTIPGVAFSPSPVAYGETPAGGFADALLTLTNSGLAAMQIENVEIIGSAKDRFTILSGGGTGTVAPGGTRDITLRFAPLVNGSHQAQLELTINAPDPVALVDLSGTGVRPAIVSIPAVEVPGRRTSYALNVSLPEGYEPDVQELYYRKGGEVDYRGPVAVNGGTVAIPAGQVTERGLSYYLRFVTSTADGDVVQTIPETDPEENPIAVRVSVASLKADVELEEEEYQMVSVPLVLEKTHFEFVLGDEFGVYDQETWRLLRWSEENQDYIEGNDLQQGFQPGRAFWLITKEDSIFDVNDGLSVNLDEPVTITLTPGWNQIGNPYAFDIAWDDVENSGLVDAPVSYDGDEFEYDEEVLEPWHGYFVFNDPAANGGQEVVLSFNPVEAEEDAGKRIRRSPLTGVDYGLQLEARLERYGLVDRHNYLALHPQALTQRDSLDYAEAPPIDQHVRLSLLEDEHYYAASYKPADDNGQHWDLQLTTSVYETLPSRKTITLTLHETGTLPQGYARIVLDLDRGTPLVPDEAGTLTLELGSQEVRHLRIILGTEDYALSVADEIPLEPLDDLLLPNYPNPFNPETVIPYQVSARQLVRLVVYDLLGRQVAVLVDEEQRAGRYEVRFDAHSQHGTALASGVYIYHLVSGSYRSTGKMVLMR